MNSSGPESRRDGQVRSAFAAILDTLLGSTTGMLGAVLADEEGEAVDHAGELKAYDVKLAAAYWQIALRLSSEASPLRALHRLVVDADRFSYVVQALLGCYVLVVVCQPRIASSVSERALRQVEVEISREAGFPLPDDGHPCWTRVGVQQGPDHRPARLLWFSGAVDGLEVIEDVHDLDALERGYRVRARSAGQELMLVREPSGAWYAANSR